MAVNNTRQKVAYGLSQQLPDIFPSPIVSNRAPTTADKAFIGQAWVFPGSNSVYFLTSIVNNSANWENVGGGSGIFTSLTVNPGPISLTGTTTINTTGNANTTIGNTAGSGAIALNVGSGNFAINGGGHTINIGTDAANTIAIGSTAGAASLTLAAGTGNFLVSGAATTTMTIGSIAQTGTITLGQSTAGQTINIGNAANAGAQVINIASGASGANSTVDILTGNGTAGTQTLNVLTGTRAGAISFGTGAAANQVTIGSTTAGAVTTIQGQSAALGGIQLDAGGMVGILPGTATVAGTSLTLSTQVGVATFTGLTTAATAKEVVTITNTLLTTTSAMLVTVSNLGSNDAQMTLSRVQQLAGSFVVTATNNGAAALNGNLVVSFWVFAP